MFQFWTKEPDGFFMLPEVDLDTVIKRLIRWKAYAQALERAGLWRTE